MSVIPTPTILTQVNESAKQQAMASVRFYGRGIVHGTAAAASRWSPESKSSRWTIDPPL